MANLIKGQSVPEVQGYKASSVNVWVVDDDTGFRELFSRTLNTDPGLSCSRQYPSAPLMLAALQLLPPPDVIVLDFKMPGMTGLETLPRIRQLAPATAVLMFTTFFDFQLRQQALAAGARGYFRKTEPIENLIAAIHAAPKNPTPAPVPNPPPVTGIAKLRQLFGARNHQ